MKKIFLLIPILFMAINTFAQENFKTLPDPKEGDSEMLVGAITEKDIAANNTCNWFDKGIKEYKPDSNRIKDLKKITSNLKFVVVIGTWCGDTQYLIPRFFKTAHLAGIKENQIEMYGVDRAKHGLNAEHLVYKISKVPTIIIYDGPREIGRIIEETKKENIETELQFIIERDIEIEKQLK
jgi:thiol-disulfide isomerase/thioredoxin